MLGTSAFLLTTVLQLEVAAPLVHVTDPGTEEVRRPRLPSLIHGRLGLLQRSCLSVMPGGFEEFFYRETDMTKEMEQ